MQLIRHQNCFSDGNEKESIITDNSVNKDPFPEVWKSGKGCNHSSALHPPLFQRDESRAPHLLQLLRQSRKRHQEDESHARKV